MYRYLLFPLLLFLLSSCSSIEKINGSTEDETYYLRGKAYLEDGSYDMAVSYLEKVKKKFSYSPYYVDAEFLLAKCSYASGKYIQAEQEFLSFISLHPDSKHIAEAKYMFAMSIYKQIPGSEDRDLSLVDKAIVAFREAMTNDKYALDALEKITELKRLKAEHVLYVANFYKKRHNCVSAIGRYQDLIDNFAFKDLVEEARKGIEECNKCLQDEKYSEKSES